MKYCFDIDYSIKNLHDLENIKEEYHFDLTKEVLPIYIELLRQKYKDLHPDKNHVLTITQKTYTGKPIQPRTFTFQF